MFNQLLRIRRYKLPLFLEFSLVLSVSLGYFIFSAIYWTSFNEGESKQIIYGNSEILSLTIYESIVLIIVVLIIKWQHKSVRDLGLTFSFDKITMGLVLFVSNYLIYVMLFKLFGDFIMGLTPSGEGSEAVSFVIQVDLIPLLIFSLLNPVFEELILVGYIVSAIRHKFSLISCLIISVGFRLSFHIYQGPIILLSILPMGIIFIIYFWHKRSIIPLIIGHSLMDFLSFYVFMAMQNP